MIVEPNRPLADVLGGIKANLLTNLLTQTKTKQVNRVSKREAYKIPNVPNLVSAQDIESKFGPAVAAKIDQQGNILLRKPGERTEQKGVSVDSKPEVFSVMNSLPTYDDIKGLQTFNQMLPDNFIKNNIFAVTPDNKSYSTYQLKLKGPLSSKGLRNMIAGGENQYKALTASAKAGVQKLVQHPVFRYMIAQMRVRQLGDRIRKMAADGELETDYFRAGNPELTKKTKFMNFIRKVKTGTAKKKATNADEMKEKIIAGATSAANKLAAAIKPETYEANQLLNRFL